jgi:hypothetical protein
LFMWGISFKGGRSEAGGFDLCEGNRAGPGARSNRHNYPFFKDGLPIAGRDRELFAPLRSYAAR